MHIEAVFSTCLVAVLEGVAVVDVLRGPGTARVRRHEAHALITLHDERKLGDMLLDVGRGQAGERAVAVNHVGVGRCRAQHAVLVLHERKRHCFQPNKPSGL